MQHIRPLRPAVVVIWLLLGGGCVGPQVTSRNGALLPSRCPYEPDIPLPAGFKLADQSSEDWSSGSIRYLRHRYGGRADKYAVRKFYREQMPLVRWTAISDSAVHGRLTMRFERADESCTVTIEEEPAGLSSRVVVEVKIAPLAHRPAAQTERS
ncbi:MAG: hypothetical protein WBE26_15620 [Phycisphaerae bacterium]